MLNNYNVIRLEEADIDALVELESASFEKAWRSEDFLQAIQGDSVLIYGIKDKGLLLSYLVIRSIPEMSKIQDNCHAEFEILNIATRIEYKKRGLAHALMQCLVDKALSLRVENIFLDVRASNIAAISLYNKHNFKEISRRKNYYSTCNSKEDAIIMKWSAN